MKTNFYKTIFCAVALLFSSSFQAGAQISNYVFSQSNGIYIPITGGISLGNATTTNDEYFVDATSKWLCVNLAQSLELEARKPWR